MNEQQIFNLANKEHFFEDDFCISQSNETVYNFLKKWPKWNFTNVNIFGPEKSGKTFLLSLFAKRNSFTLISGKDLKKNNLDSLLASKKLIIEDISTNINEDLLFLIFNHFKNNDNFLIFSSACDTANIEFKLNDLRSRFKSVHNIEIYNPSDSLIYSILLKHLSNRQIILNPKSLNYISNKIERSYLAVNNFVKALDEKSLVQKKKIDRKLINEILS